MQVKIIAEHSAILSTFFKLTVVFKIFALSFFEWPFYTGFASFAIILKGSRELVALLGLSSWCFVVVVWLFLAMLCVCLRFVIVVFPYHTHLSF